MTFTDVILFLFMVGFFFRGGKISDLKKQKQELVDVNLLLAAEVAEKQAAIDRADLAFQEIDEAMQLLHNAEGGTNPGQTADAVLAAKFGLDKKSRPS